MKTLYKSFKAKFKNEHGDIDWKIGEWYHQDGEIKACKNGFHGSKRTIDAMRYVNCEILALVEVKGKHDDEDDKSAYEYMRIKQAWYWKKEDSVALSIFAAELCLKNFEKVFPNDKRPREAIQAAKDYLECPCKKHESAAESAWSVAWSAARSAASAASAARSAAESAASAAWSAASAAESAAESAASAAWSAESAAWSAASAASAAWSAARSSAWSVDKVLDKCDKWIIKRIKTLEEIKNV